ncbi:MAG: trehalase family glycosidase, partial [Saprospiraceae bacterium]
MIEMKLPEIVFEHLFHDIATQYILDDGKSLADAIPKFSPEIILSNYTKEKVEPGFSVADFYSRHFDAAASQKHDFVTDPDKPLVNHLHDLWDHLLRQADQHIEGSTLIPLPYPYIVPGGRFNEIYYWDSYFTMLGLKVSGRVHIIESMIKNFAHLISEIGFIPNGNRSYFLSRSQPPFFSLMVEMLANLKGQSVKGQYLTAMTTEYAFWTKGDSKISSKDNMSHHSVLMDDDTTMHRYWDELDTPRSEMYVDDLSLSENQQRTPTELFSNLRAA